MRWMVCVLFLVVSCDTAAPEPAEPEEWALPLNVGDRWIANTWLESRSGFSFSMPPTDTMVITRDSTFWGQRWYWVESSGRHALLQGWYANTPMGLMNAPDSAGARWLLALPRPDQEASWGSVSVIDTTRAETASGASYRRVRIRRKIHTLGGFSTPFPFYDTLTVSPELGWVRWITPYYARGGTSFYTYAYRIHWELVHYLPARTDR
ncbi:MAG: hypothetical protein JJ896_01950 [Rhodothermales bacterium]|nr:hypothetical protein [Rhodothermales bacterium]MBO6778391.1 hypothetical protein [Rhodothermales bacterium]